MMKMKWLMTVLLLVTVAGCGYRLSGGGYLTGHTQRVGVAVFENQSSESRAGVSFANELIREITQRTETRVVGVQDAAHKITGIVKSITFSTLSRSSVETVAERQVTAVLDVKLTGADGRVIWSVRDFSATETYKTSSSALNDEANKRAAVDAIALRVAERLVSQMVSDF